MNFAFVVAVLVGVCSAGFYDGDPDVTVLSEPEQFVETVLNSASVWVVEFYAPWCTFSHETSPLTVKVVTAKSLLQSTKRQPTA